MTTEERLQVGRQFVPKRAQFHHCFRIRARPLDRRHIHHGEWRKIECESAGPGLGTTMVIYLPATPDVPQRRSGA